ncbi:hypothetical protein AAGG74_14850 [Bacillus mexicanus]|uniref:hypothetical protein n=1 Tax=Bacillus mexicanus TaxID=2834415 RepID=UPI003D24B360
MKEVKRKMDYTIESQLIRTLIATAIVACLYLLLNRGLKKVCDRIDDHYYVTTLRKVGQNFIQYSFFLIYLVYIISVFVNVAQIVFVVAAFILTLMFILKSKIVSIVTGLYRILSGIISVNDDVIINGTVKGTVREISLNTIKIFGDENSVTVLDHTEIKTIEKLFKGLKEVKATAIISFREDPEKVEDILIKLTTKINEKFSSYLIKVDEEKMLEKFTYEGITKLNSGYQGIEYTIRGTVYSDDYDDIKRKIDRELAICIYKNRLKVFEQNVFFKTRAEK